jgi:hypothetical protein
MSETQYITLEDKNIMMKWWGMKNNTYTGG